ncbi:nonribosomal siderophore peptide synthase SidC [Penicillium hetheringtonii]|uniref:Nonribosomal siderophore peptide synthase SidC n=1 Tax=Penicillium hetheringtonii TaxID=911720 RepID=A0AAD6GPI5_9EURO|nr:nonribosomal siderophore peptide synthase SidC [Penicillium hetheringtonii]
MTVTPLTVDIDTSSKQYLLKAVQGHSAQLTRFAQTDKLDALAPKSNSTINIIYSGGDEEVRLNGIEKPQKLQRHKLDEPLAPDYLTNTLPSSNNSTVDGLDTSLMPNEQLYFNVLVASDGEMNINVSGDEKISQGDRNLVNRLARDFVSELSVFFHG